MIPPTNLDSSQIVAVNMLFIIHSLRDAHCSQLGNNTALSSDGKKVLSLGMAKRRGNCENVFFLFQNE